VNFKTIGMKTFFSSSKCAPIRALILSVALIGPIIGNAQRAIILKGTVTDFNATTLPYVTLTINHKPIGTITNTDGEFELPVTSPSAEDTLVVSMLGYNSYRASLSTISVVKNLRIRLEEKPILLNEVVVVAKKVEPEEVVRKALKNVQNNSPSYPSMLKAFYRETHEENNRTVILVEAALDIYDNKESPIEKVSLKDSRASKNYRNRALANTAVEKWNLAAGALNNNPVKNRDRFISTRKKFSLDSILYYNDRLIYVISFLTYIRRFPNFERKNTLHIDAENFAIYRYGWEEYAKKGKYSEAPWRLSEESIYFSKRKRISTIYEFGEYGGKMFLKYFDEKAFDDIYNSKGDSVEFETLGHVTMVVTNIETKNVKTEAKETMRRDQSISVQVKDYHPEFWHDSNNIALVPLTRKQIKNLEWEMPLEEQFKNQNSKK
jgi:hypothetical protein